MRKLFQFVNAFVKSYALPLTLLVVFINVLIGGWTILHGDIFFNTDIARDFLLLQELSQKGIILIGPRASGLPGLFHGPLWLYLNYPAYALGHGNPVVVGYFWILLNIAFLGISYFVATKLFTRTVANVYVILLSGATIYYVDNLFNPYGAMFVLPLFLYTIINYVRTLHWKYLVANLVLLGSMIQFQMAIGLPFLILTICYLCYVIHKNKKYTHLFSFFLLLLPFSTFILFDLRHEFQQTHAILNAFSGNSTIPQTPYIDRIENRWSSMTQNLYFAQGNHSSIVNGIVSLFLIFFLYGQLFHPEKKQNKNRIIYSTILYFYIGFYLISIFFNGELLYYYTFPLLPLLFLVFSSMLLYQKKTVFFLLLLFVMITNGLGGFAYSQENVHRRGVVQTSWLFHLGVAQKIFQSNDNNFGYFIYTPDFYAYAPKYAFTYTKSLHPEKTVYLFQKKPITYLVAEPPPPNHPELDSMYWERDKLRLTKKPVHIDILSNGFQIKKYTLTQKEIEVQADPDTGDWIHFR